MRSGSAERLKHESGMVTAHEATLHAQDPRSPSSSLRVWLPAPLDRAALRDVAVHGQRLPGARGARRAEAAPAQAPVPFVASHSDFLNASKSVNKAGSRSRQLSSHRRGSDNLTPAKAFSASASETLTGAGA